MVFSRNFDAGKNTSPDSASLAMCVFVLVSGDECDLELDPDNEEQYIVWGIGGLGETAFRHFIRAESKSHKVLHDM